MFNSSKLLNLAQSLIMMQYAASDCIVNILLNPDNVIGNISDLVRRKMEIEKCDFEILSK